MDMGIIAALKKRYKYRLLRDVIAYHNLPQDAKDTMNLSASKMQCGAVGVEYGKAATLFDAAQYAVEAWSDLSEQTLKNCFIKADVIPSFKNLTSLEEPQNFDDFIAEFHNCSLSSRMDMDIVLQEISDVCHVDDESNPVYQQCILEDIDDIIQHVEEGKAVSDHD